MLLIVDVTDQSVQLIGNLGEILFRATAEFSQLSDFLRMVRKALGMLFLQVRHHDRGVLKLANRNLHLRVRHLSILLNSPAYLVSSPSYP